MTANDWAVVWMLRNVLALFWSEDRGHVHSCPTVWQANSNEEAAKKKIACSELCQTVRQALERSQRFMERPE